MRWLLDPLGLSGTYVTGEDRSSLAQATSKSYGVALDYILAPPSAAVRLGPARFRLSPTTVRFRSILSGTDAARTSFRVPVADSGDALLVPARSRPKAWRNTLTVDLLPLPGVQLRTDLASQRDLRDYGDSTAIARVARLARRSLLGLDVGLESQRTLGTFFGLTPRIAQWLRPRGTLSTGFSLTRDPNGRDAAPLQR